MARMMRSGRHAPAHRVFFLLACGQAAATVPLWSARWLGWLPDAGGAASHAHDMLMGFALAVVGGFLLTRLSHAMLAATVAAWLAGRLFGGPADLAYPALLAVLAGGPFLRSARSGHNLVFFPIVAGFLAAEALVRFGEPARGSALALDLVAALLLVMGGRILPAAMAGAVRARGESLEDRNRAGLERMGIAAMAVAALAHLVPLPEVAAAGWAVAGLSGLARLSRWRWRAALPHPSLWPLHLGYGWLCAGLAATPLATWTGLWPPAAALHAVTVGGLGTITAVMMVRTVMLRDRVSAGFPRTVSAAVILLSAAALARLLAPLAPDPLVPLSAALWSAAFLLTGMAILRLPQS